MPKRGICNAQKVAFKTPIIWHFKYQNWHLKMVGVNLSYSKFGLVVKLGHMVWSNNQKYSVIQFLFILLSGFDFMTLSHKDLTEKFHK